MSTQPEREPTPGRCTACGRRAPRGKLLCRPCRWDERRRPGLGAEPFGPGRDVANDQAANDYGDAAADKGRMDAQRERRRDARRERRGIAAKTKTETTTRNQETKETDR